MSYRTKRILILVLSIVAFAIVIYFYPKNLKFSQNSSVQPKARLSLLQIAESGVYSADNSDSESVYNLSLNDLIAAVTNDDVCKVAKNRYSHALADRVKILMSAPDKIKVDAEQDRLLEELFSGALAGKAPKSTNAELVLDFYNALFFADLLEPIVNDQKNLDYADQLLLSLQARDPDNGAYAYFRTFVLKEKGAEKATLKSEMIKSANSPKFDTFLMDISRRLFEKSFASSTHFLIGISATSDLPIPNYSKPTSIVKELRANDPNIDQALVKLGKTMMQPGVEAQGQYEFIHWAVIEYAIGYSFVKNSMDNNNNNNKIFSSYPSFKELALRGRSEEQILRFSRSLQSLNTKTGCNREAYDREVKKEEQSYINFLRTLPQ
jgi:hypothetical protein